MHLSLCPKETDLSITKVNVLDWLRAYGQVIEEQKNYLTELDSRYWRCRPWSKYVSWIPGSIEEDPFSGR